MSKINTRVVRRSIFTKIHVFENLTNSQKVFKKIIFFRLKMAILMVKIEIFAEILAFWSK